MPTINHHAQFYQNGEYQPYAQYGALKIYNINDIMRWIREAPRLDESISRIRQPVLFIYGGEDQLIGVNHGVLPEQIKKMYDKLETQEKKIIIVPGADHTLDRGEKTDSQFNSNPKYGFVKQIIFDHFAKYLL